MIPDLLWCMDWKRLLAYARPEAFDAKRVFGGGKHRSQEPDQRAAPSERRRAPEFGRNRSEVGPQGAGRCGSDKYGRKRSWLGTGGWWPRNLTVRRNDPPLDVRAWSDLWKSGWCGWLRTIGLGATRGSRVRSGTIGNGRHV